MELTHNLNHHAVPTEVYWAAWGKMTSSFTLYFGSLLDPLFWQWTVPETSPPAPFEGLGSPNVGIRLRS